MKFMIYFYARHIESRDFSRVGKITHSVFCLHHLRRMPVDNIGTIGTNGITNGTIGKTLNGICLPMVPFFTIGKNNLLYCANQWVDIELTYNYQSYKCCSVL